MSDHRVAPDGVPDGPATGELRDRLGPSLWNLVSAVGRPLIGADEIGGGQAGNSRRTFRLWFRGGSSVKGRRFGSAVRAEIVWRIHASARVPFLARAMAREGDAMLEKWVEGDVLVQGRVPGPLLREAGRMLGMLHTCPTPSIGDLGVRPADGDAWVRKTVASLRALHDRGLVTTESQGVLANLVASERPSDASPGIVHRDLCPGNLVADARGRLISVDNGTMTIGAIDHDLCRLWYRWPMTSGERAAFNDGYREHLGGGVPDRPSRFWATVVVVNSARMRLAVSAAAAAEALRRLDEVVPEARAAGRPAVG